LIKIVEKSFTFCEFSTNSQFCLLRDIASQRSLKLAAETVWLELSKTVFLNLKNILKCSYISYELFNFIIKFNKNVFICYPCLSSFFQLLTAICGGGRNDLNDWTSWIVSIKAEKVFKL